MTVTAANIDERDSLHEIVENIQGMLICDKGLISSRLQMEFKNQNLDLQTPLRKNVKDDRDSYFVKLLVSTRRIIETVIGQLTEQLHIERTKARDIWHLTGRIARKILAHTLESLSMLLQDENLCIWQD